MHIICRASYFMHHVSCMQGSGHGGKESVRTVENALNRYRHWFASSVRRQGVSRTGPLYFRVVDTLNTIIRWFSYSVTMGWNRHRLPTNLQWLVGGCDWLDAAGGFLHSPYLTYGAAIVCKKHLQSARQLNKGMATILSQSQNRETEKRSGWGKKGDGDDTWHMMHDARNMMHSTWYMIHYA